MRHPEDLTPGDILKAPVIVALLIVASILERFELMPLIRAAGDLPTHPQQEKPL